MRGLSESFLQDMLNSGGLLRPILEQVKQDHTILLAIRENYINIYYRGGNLLKIEEKGKGIYQASFDTEYNEAGKNIPSLPSSIAAPQDITAWVEAFPCLKQIMDFYFSNHNKPEREFQQLIARENNYSTISGETEYFISDIEFADSILGARFDLLAVRWLSSDRKNGSKCRVAFIEMKYGDSALDGNSGLLEHLKDMDEFIGRSYKSLTEMIEVQINQLDRLGLLKFKHCVNGTKVQLAAEQKPEVIFLLANHNPRSSKLKNIINDPRIAIYAQSNKFDLKFYVSSFAGYGLHADCMVSLSDFRTLLRA